MRKGVLVAGIGIAALLFSGCSTSSTSGEKTTVTETVTSSATHGTPAAPATSGAAATGGLPQPPAGARQIRSSDSDGMTHTRYSIEGQTPKQVADYYVGIWAGEGYTINDSSSGGGGYGKYGGSGASATGSKSGTFVAVDAGARNDEPTYFDVCHGTNEKLVVHCGEGHHGN